ncbi:MAG TPA: hypothetical protein VGD79_03515 [Thermoanaerobaculia bacterium]|jgi:DNA-binding NtrC family response regulator
MVSRVLVIEPYPDLREAIMLTLRREHFSCDAVAAVADAEVQIGRHDYSCVVVDGDTMREVVATLDPATHVIALPKPFGRDELLLGVRRP